MPRKASKKDGRSNANDVEWGGYVDIRLDEDQKTAFYLWQRDHEEEVWTDFAEIVGSGFKFGLSYDSDGDYYTATLTAAGKHLMGLENRYCMTARAPEWQTALSLLLYKHLEIAHGDWGTYKPRTGRMDNFG